MYFANCVLSVVAVLVVVVFTTPCKSPYFSEDSAHAREGFLTALFGIGIMYWFVSSLYVTTSREIKRFDVSPFPFDGSPC